MKRYLLLLVIWNCFVTIAKNGDLIKMVDYVPERYDTMPEDYRSYVSAHHYSSVLQQLSAIDDVEFYDITYESDGHCIRGYLVRPHLEPNKTYPVIIYNRGGLREWGKIDLIDICTHFYEFAKAGYIVLASQYRGCNGASGKDEFGGADINDVLNLFTVAQQLPYVQQHNFFMVGFSRGGLMTYLALKNKVQVNAAAVMAGVTDLFSFERTKPDMALLMTIFVGTLGIPKIQAYTARSVTKWIDEINVPILLMHNTKDPVVPASQSIDFAGILASTHKPYKLIMYEEESHQIVQHRHEAHEALFDWFDRYTY